MNKYILFIMVVCIVLKVNAQTAVTDGKGFNCSSFTAQKKVITPELQSLTDKSFYTHPEYGVQPYKAPCSDCFELLQKRDETHRYFVKSGTNREFCQQTSYGAINYMDNGVFRTID